MIDKRFVYKFKNFVRALVRLDTDQTYGEDSLDLEAALQHRSIDSISGILGWLLSLGKSEFESLSLKGCKALEIGSGKFFINALLLYVCGCSEVISIDKYKQLLPNAMKLAISKPVLARRFLSMHISHDEFMKRMGELSRTGYSLEGMENLGIYYRAPFDILSSKDFNNKFGFVFSYTVLEHVSTIIEIKALLKKTVDALKPGGFCIHFVDLEDHSDSVLNPFEFLSKDTVWSEKQSFSRGNRLRFATWKNIFSHYKDMDWRFPYAPVRYDVDLPAIDVSVEYQDEQDIRTSAFVVVGRKIKQTL
ncbi:hypothetical protein ACFL1Z_00325 [Thermodesulfobacteriota bacterium]